MLSVTIDRAVKGHDFRLIASVYMSEHVHLLALPTGPNSLLSGLLKAVKQPPHKPDQNDIRYISSRRYPRDTQVY